MRRWIKETVLTMGQSLRLLVKGKQTIWLLALSVVLLVAMLLSMDDVKEEKSRIAIGMVNEDESEPVEKVITGMKQKDMYEVTVGNEKELLEKLKAGELAAVCVFRNGYEERIQRGDTSDLVAIYEAASGEALLLGDILAGVMMQEICEAKSYQTLLSYAEKAGKEIQISAEEYKGYSDKILQSGDAEFFFEVTYVEENGTVSEKPSQAVIYEQAIVAVFALMTGVISIYSVLPFRQMRYGRLAERMKTLPVHNSALYAGSALAGLLIPMVFGGLFLLCLALRHRIGFLQIISLLICTMVYSCVIVCMMLLAAYLIKNHTVYQMGMLAMILLFGIFGLVSLVEGLLIPEGMTDWVPNGWYVRKMTELLH